MYGQTYFVFVFRLLSRVQTDLPPGGDGDLVLFEDLGAHHAAEGGEHRGEDEEHDHC